MAARFKMDTREVAFTMEECGYEVLDAAGPGLTCFCGGVSVRAAADLWEPTPVWTLRASTGAVATCRSADDVTDFLMDLRNPPSVTAFFDGEVVLRLAQAA